MERMEGFLKKKKKRSLFGGITERLFVLDTQQLVWYKKKDAEARKRPTCLDVAHIMSVRTMGGGDTSSFEVDTRDRKIVLLAPNSFERERWVTAIEKSLFTYWGGDRVDNEPELPSHPPSHDIREEEGTPTSLPPPPVLREPPAAPSEDVSVPPYDEVIQRRPRIPSSGVREIPPSQLTEEEIRAKLLDSDMLTAEAEAIVKEAFLRFDEDGDGALNRKELNNFNLASGYEEVDEETLDMLRQSFKADEHGNLVQAGFLTYFHWLVQTDVAGAWDILCRLGYDERMLLQNAGGTEELPLDMLVDSNGMLTKECEEALTEVFSRFDADEDGALNRAEMNAFNAHCGYDPVDDETLLMLRQSFKVNAAQDLTLQGFLDYFYWMISTDAQGTWEMLKKLMAGIVS